MARITKSLASVSINRKFNEIGFGGSLRSGFVIAYAFINGIGQVDIQITTKQARRLAVELIRLADRAEVGK